MTLLTIFFLVLFGLVFGSFLNVCISRLPEHQSVVSPRSRCPRCGTPIRALDNIPIVSWVRLRARCRACRAPIPLRYPLVELALPVLWIVCFESFGLTTSFVGAAVLCFLLLGLAAMDAETMRLPDAFTLPGIAAGVVFAALAPANWTNPLLPHEALWAAGSSLAAAALAGGAILLIRWTYQWLRGSEGLGLGDAKLLAMIAAWLGIRRTFLAFFLAVVAAAFAGIVVLLWRRRQMNLRSWLGARLPLGTFLAVAAIYSLFLGWSSIRWYIGLF
jgi:leader peptidase (prepilin peptidase) / N-methyltransferase